MVQIKKNKKIKPINKALQSFFMELIDNDTLIIIAVVIMVCVQDKFVSEAITGLLAFLGAKIKK